ncbi:UNVERIFIED_CONTAM: hypothetical protein GTU68_047920 [Idotea baltica]|nr:hypothetical protein [Idotea baltica]
MKAACQQLKSMKRLRSTISIPIKSTH